MRCVVGLCLRTVAVGYRAAAGLYAVDAELRCGTRIFGDTPCTHILLERAVKPYLLAEVRGIVAEVTEFAEFRILRKRYYKALVVVRAVGCRTDYKRIGENYLAAPFYIGVRTYCRHLGSHGTYYVTRCPSFGAAAGLLYGDGLLNGVRIILAARFDGRVAEVHASCRIKQRELPGVGIGVVRCRVIVEDTHNVAVALREHHVAEYGIARCAHRQCLAVCVLQQSVGGYLVSVGESGLASLHETYVVESH